MDYLRSLIASFISDPQQVTILVYLVAVAGAVLLAFATATLIAGIYSPMKVKVQELAHVDTPSSMQGRSAFDKRLEKLEKISVFKGGSDGDSETKKLLIHAGFHNENALLVFKSLKLLSLLIAASLTLLLIKYFPNMSQLATFYFVALILGVGYLIPSLVLEHFAKQRMREMRKFFPDALDLLVVCTESGLGLLEAFQRVSQELEIAHPELSHELKLVCQKVKVGFSMQEALNEFGERTGLEDIKGLNAVIVQSLKLGTGVANTIRVYSEEYKDKRLQEAEEKAAKIGVKLLFPMLLFIWPSFFIVAVGPAVLKILKVWGLAFG
ncbi:type II secretion system F family protein [Paraferrimonas sedimenticola]|uniref:Pilus assembly protein TadC n=1 Tax=Paraferrimonas sedimenticola TaxID=375674 RepID=A0AA37RU05_9GAMM|nr:type II secretion system F family protein [Paraferrimonas sedimenticola]GLP94907.1 pilus assembly protein TadC [Paraferrimonas sedimenticola]